MAMLARAGSYAVVGYGGRLSNESVLMVALETNAIGNLVGTWPDLWELVQLHAEGRLRLRTETHPLDEVNEVLAGLRGGEITGRAVLVPA
jgi:NAD+-dependent secondary alcohol dehydrogenase Adh1